MYRLELLWNLTLLAKQSVWLACERQIAPLEWDDVDLALSESRKILDDMHPDNKLALTGARLIKVETIDILKNSLS